MTIKNLSFKAQLLAAAGMVLLLWLSNQHFSFASVHTRAVAGDTKGYFWIATDAPELDSKKVPQHRAQRFVIPVAIGVVARGLGLQEETGFYLTVLVISFAIIYRWQRLIQWCGYSGPTAVAITAMLIFNPYAFRFCFAFPGMVGDLVFIWSLLHVLDSLLKGQGVFLLFWTILMALARQTALVCLPAIVFGILLLPSWHKPQKTRILYAFKPSDFCRYGLSVYTLDRRAVFNPNLELALFEGRNGVVSAEIRVGGVHYFFSQVCDYFLDSFHTAFRLFGVWIYSFSQPFDADPASSLVDPYGRYLCPANTFWARVNWRKYTKIVCAFATSCLAAPSTVARDDAFRATRFWLANQRPAPRTLDKFAPSYV